MGIGRKTRIVVLLITLCTLYGCRHIPVPKPRGHFRIDLPKHKYIQFNGHPGKDHNIPLSFEYPVYGQISFQGENGSDPGWFDIGFPFYKAKIYLTYKDIKNDLDSLLDQSYDINVKYHVSKADAIKEQVFNNTEK